MGDDSEIPTEYSAEDIRAALAAAEMSDYRFVDSIGEHGGNGAWYLQAVIAYDSGYDKASLYALQQSVQNDDQPFRTKALTTLLQRDPSALRRPLSALNKSERDFGVSKESRSARIAVLDFLDKDRKLLEEYETFQGTPGEAAVLAAAMESDPKNPSIQAVAERYILHCPDPEVLEKLPEAVVADLGLGAPYLLGARIAFSRELYDEALEEYRLWIESFPAEGSTCDFEDPPPVFAEIYEAAIKTENAEQWGAFLSDAATGFSGAKRFGAAFQAGKLKRESGEFLDAAVDFSVAAASLESGLQRDRALWYRLRVAYQATILDSTEEMNIWLTTWSAWEDPRRFDDRLEEFLHRRARTGEWRVLEEVFNERGEDWPAHVRSHFSLVLGFAASEGRLSGDITPRAYFEDALHTDPVSWSGMRAAGLLGKDLELREGAWSEPGRVQSLDDLLIQRYLDWGFDSLAYRTIMDNPTDYTADTIRNVSMVLAEDSPRLSIRVAGLLWEFEDYQPHRADLLLRHPLPFGDMAARFAEKEGVPPEIMHGLIRTESAWDATAISRSGAMGLAQFMPATWSEWVRRMQYPTDSDPTDPEVNAALGAAYLDWLHDREWTWGWIDSLASYNAGGGRVRTWRRQRPGLGDDLFGESIPVEEPRSYIRKVLSAATLYGYLYNGDSPAELHEEWGLDMIEVN